MKDEPVMEITYFPGCSLATSARESNESLVRICESLGLKLTEIEDWNCCGSSSAHSVDQKLGLELCARNLVRADKERPIMTMCPSCFRNLLSARSHLAEDPELRRAQERKWGGSINPDQKIVSFLELLHFLNRLRAMGAAPSLDVRLDLKALKVAPYYGCMAMFPPSMGRALVPFQSFDDQLGEMGAEVLTWAGRNKCCGTFLTAARPELTVPLINKIMQSAIDVGAECLATACAMCQLNLEIRCTLEHRIPVFHFSEIMALALGSRDYGGWFKRHLVDPVPLLKNKQLIGSQA